MSWLDHFELFSLYWKHALLCLLASSLLAIWGGYIAAQKKSLESFYISQAAVFGGLLGMHLGVFPMAISLVIALIALPIQNFLKGSSRVGATELQMSGYIIFLTLSLFLIQWSPVLKSHFIPALFGDISLLSTKDLIWSSLLIIPCLALTVQFRSRLILESFELNLFSSEISTSLNVLRILILVFSIKYFGLLFTLAFLFLPTTLIQKSTDKSLKRHQWKCLASTNLAILTGFPLSLAFPHLQTTPTLVSCLLIWCLALRFFPIKLIRTVYDK